VLNAMKNVKLEILATNLSNDQEQNLREAFGQNSPLRRWSFVTIVERALELVTDPSRVGIDSGRDA